MVYKPRRERKARGGKAASEPLHPEHGHLYNAEGSPESKEIDAKSDGFKRGGHLKRKHGGKVEGHEAKKHMGKRARGGATHPHMEVHMGEHHEDHGKGEHHSGGHHGGKSEHHGHHEGERTEHHVKRARGGHVPHKARGGGSPYSEAHKLTPPGNDKHDGPGENAATIP